MVGSPAQPVPTTERVIADPVANRVSRVFNGLFAVSARTVMVGGGTEPLFSPATRNQRARLVFTRATQLSAAAFDTDVRAAAIALNVRGLPPRAARLRDALAAEFNTWALALG